MARPSSVCAVVGGGARASAACAECFRWACLKYVEVGEGLAALDYGPSFSLMIWTSKELVLHTHTVPQNSINSLP